MEGVLALVRKHGRSADGTISSNEFASLMRSLDSSGFWTGENLQALISSVGAARDGDRLHLETLIRGVYAKAGPTATADYAAVRSDLKQMMDSPEWDDGSYAPLLIRLAWHSSGTYCKADGSGGSNGATMRHALEAGDPENAGLGKARELMDSIKRKYAWLSCSDLWILAAYVAIEHTRGPVIKFTGGRADAPAEKAIAPGRLPEAEYGLTDGGMKVDSEGRIEGWEKLAAHVRGVFARMGLTDREAVALLCGGHVYGRCHTEHSGYAGAWVENPTMFSNEYAADMIEDKWLAVTHDTIMPDGGQVPEEVRPAPGKRQYIDLTKYEDDDDEEEQAALNAPDVKDFPPGRYRCVTSWCNCRELPDTESPILGRFVTDQRLSMLCVKAFGTAVRGLAECGGWVSIVASGGTPLFEREADLDFKALTGRYRAIAKAGVPQFKSLTGDDATGRINSGEEFDVSEVTLAQNGNQQGSLHGRCAGAETWALLYSPQQGLAAEHILKGYNEGPRRPIKSQTGHQMMLASDMVLLWDEGFREHLQAYADDEDLLKKDFGDAFKKLTELGCPWTTDNSGECKASIPSSVTAVHNGCPFLASAAAA